MFYLCCLHESLLARECHCYLQGHHNTDLLIAGEFYITADFSHTFLYDFLRVCALLKCLNSLRTKQTGAPVDSS